MTTKKITITADHHNHRLDIVIAAELGISRSLAQKMIDLGQITVNGKIPKKAGNTMKNGYAIVIDETVKASTNKKGRAMPAPIASKKKTARALTPKVIAETADYVVINKPSGLLVHPTQAKEVDSLTAWLVKKYPEVKKVGDDPTVRPGIVHRLDKEASGLMVIARTQKMFNHLKKQFKNRAVEKEYYALVHDRVAKDWDEITFPIARGENNDRMAARPRPPSLRSGEAGGRDNALTDGEKSARTEFIAERHFVNFSLLKVKIHTGRMHQIRVHMLAYNHPIVGDSLYFQKKRKHAWDEKLGRLFLHSTELGFVDLAGDHQTFHSPLPKELSNFLTLLS